MNLNPNDLTVHQLQGWCYAHQASVSINADGTIYGSQIAEHPVRTQLSTLAAIVHDATTTAEAVVPSGVPPSQLRRSDDWPTLKHDVMNGPGFHNIPPVLGTDVPVVLHADGYASLAGVLKRAFDQAASGKGKERHQVGGEPFDAQVMQDMARRFGVGALLGQAFKKSEESQRLGHDAAVRELLGAINYLAGAVIAMEARRMVAANDNVAPSAQHG